MVNCQLFFVRCKRIFLLPIPCSLLVIIKVGDFDSLAIMYLKTLHLKQFRNYQNQKVEFTAAKTILVGNNAQGK